jgi:predicted membrane metal-binding protein
MDASRATVVDDRLPLIYRLQNGIAAVCERYGGEYAPLWQALLLGIRRDLDPTLIEELKETGLSLPCTKRPRNASIRSRR